MVSFFEYIFLRSALENTYTNCQHHGYGDYVSGGPWSEFLEKFVLLAVVSSDP